MKIFEMIRRVFVKWSRSSGITQNLIFDEKALSLNLRIFVLEIDYC